MKKEAEIGKIECFYNKLYNGSNVLFTIFILLFIGLIFLINSIFIKKTFGGIDRIYSYPEEEYVFLEREISNVIVDNRYIDMNRLSDEDIEYTKSYFKPNNKSNGTWEIILKKGDIQVNATVSESLENDLLNVKTTRDCSEIGYKIGNNIILVGIIILSFILSCIIMVILLVLFYTIIEKLVNIEKKYQK